MAEVGQVLAGRYRLMSLLGQGGMATIYHGHDSQLGRDVAVKVLRSEYGRDPAFVARFRQEAQSAAVLSHPNVVNVFDYGMEEGDPFIVMELIDGGDLAQKISAEGALDPVAAARIAQQIFEALEAAHARGIIHRDIKPTNVLLTDSGRVKVADFGIARAFSEAQLTMPGTTLGSVHYFSPEQARGEVVTSASDVYSAGLVLFEMLTARRAWTGDSAGAVAVARLTGDPPAPSSIRRGIAPVLDSAVRRALARVPADRPSAGEMAALLGGYIMDPAGARAADVVPPIPIPSQPMPGVFGTGLQQARSRSSTDYGLPSARHAGEPGPSYGTIRSGAPPRRMAHAGAEPAEVSAGAWGWIAAVLGVLVLFAGGVLLFLVLSSRPAPAHSPSPGQGMVQVPSFVGMLFDAAERHGERLGLIITVGAFQQNADVAENTVIAQDPAAGGSVARGARISVTVASRSVTVVVPEARLRTEAELFAILTQNELLPGVRSEAYDAQVPTSLIIRTNPRSGVEVARGTPIDYIVSLGFPPTPSPTPPPTPSPIIVTPPPTPSPTPSPTPTPTAPPTPTPTSSPTAAVTPPPPPPDTPTPEITVPPTPEATPVIVGNYATCGSLGEAKAQIVAADLQVGTIHSASSNAGDPADDWQVESQFPPAGAEVPPGTAVDLLVRSPADPCTPS